MGDLQSIVLCLPKSRSFSDPDPEQTEKRGVRLVTEWEGDVLGVVGWSSAGWDALALAAANPDLSRLAVLSTPFEEDEDAAVDLDLVQAKTLLLFGSKDPQTGSKHGRSWQKRLSNARLEMVPGAEHDLLDQMWGRVLSYLAPTRGRKASS